MNPVARRIAINIGGGYVPGINSAIAGVVLAARELGWEVVGIREGFDGLLFPSRYRDEGLVPLTPELVELLATGSVAVLGSNPRTDPFRVQSLNADNLVEEVDRSDELLKTIRDHGIDGVISIVSHQAMCVLYRLHRKGLKVICIPKSIENDLAATQLSFGYNSALSFAVSMLENARNAAQSARKIGVVGVPGEYAGWLALQAGMTVCADAALIPEIAYDLQSIATKLTRKAEAGVPYGLVVVADGARPAVLEEGKPQGSLQKSLAPLATSGTGNSIVDRAGLAAHQVATELQRLTGHETYPLVLGQLVKGGTPTAVDRQLGLGYGAAAVQALEQDRTGAMVAFQPPDIGFVPLSDAINKVRTIPKDSLFLAVARSLGISLGE